jgi:hypothetical protein
MVGIEVQAAAREQNITKKLTMRRFRFPLVTLKYAFMTPLLDKTVFLLLIILE